MIPSALLLVSSLTIGPYAEVRLRNVAAADAAAAVNGYALRQRLDVAAVSSPHSNTVRLTGGPLGTRRGRELLARLDVPPVQVQAQCLFVQVPAGYVDAIGLAGVDEHCLTLTPREARMLEAAVRRDKADRLSRPMLVVADGQTGSFHVGDEQHWLALRLTPRLNADNRSVEVRLEPQIATPRPGATGAHVCTVQHTSRLPLGHTVLVRIAQTDGTEVLVTATLQRIEPLPE